MDDCDKMMEASETMEESNTAYCIRCGKKTEYSIKLQRVRVNVCGVRFSYIENRPCCISCGEEVYVPKLEDRNSAARKFAFNQSLEKIRNKFDSNGGKT